MILALRCPVIPALRTQSARVAHAGSDSVDRQQHRALEFRVDRRPTSVHRADPVQQVDLQVGDRRQVRLADRQGALEFRLLVEQRPLRR